MKKVRVFVATSGSDLEAQSNTWLLQNQNINIEVSLYQVSATTFSLVLIYTETA